MQKIEAMLKLQQELNDATNGEGWEDGVTKNGKVIDWRRCIYLEAAELIESYPWKHWKNIDASPDRENIKIETVDIWHFVMSEALRIYKRDAKGNIAKLASDIVAQSGYQAFKSQAKPSCPDHYAEIAITEDFMKSLFCKDDIEILISKFFLLASVADIDPEGLYQLYIGKNILNTFRQDHGYKDGTYIKIWNGREDNVVMQEILQSSSDISPEELYAKLTQKYPQR